MSTVPLICGVGLRKNCCVKYRKFLTVVQLRMMMASFVVVYGFKSNVCFPKARMPQFLICTAVVLRMPLVMQMNWPGPMHLVTSM